MKKRRKRAKRWFDEKALKRIETGATVFTIASVAVTVALTMVAVVKISFGG